LLSVVDISLVDQINKSGSVATTNMVTEI